MLMMLIDYKIFNSMKSRKLDIDGKSKLDIIGQQQTADLGRTIEFLRSRQTKTNKIRSP